MNRIWRARTRQAGRAAVAAGAALGAMSACQTFITPENPDVPGIASRLDSETSQVCAFATQFVTTYLQATASDRAELGHYVTLQPADKLPKTPALLVDAAVCYAAKPKTAFADTNVWAVFVNTLQRTYPGAAQTRGFYQVNVGLTNDTPRALQLPTARNTPGDGADIATTYTAAIPTESPIYSLVSGFTSALLTGTPALDRYITATSGLAVIGGYQSAVLTSVTGTEQPPQTPSEGATTHVLAVVQARTISPDVAVTFTYPLTLKAASGTWTVAAIDTLPQISRHTTTPQEAPK